MTHLQSNEDFGALARREGEVEHGARACELLNEMSQSLLGSHTLLYRGG